jgi:hypothetical protein
VINRNREYAQLIARSPSRAGRFFAKRTALTYEDSTFWKNCAFLEGPNERFRACAHVESPGKLFALTRIFSTMTLRFIFSFKQFRFMKSSGYTLNSRSRLLGVFVGFGALRAITI